MSKEKSEILSSFITKHKINMEFVSAKIGVPSKTFRKKVSSKYNPHFSDQHIKSIGEVMDELMNDWRQTKRKIKACKKQEKE